MSGEVLSYCPLQDGAEINRACSYGWLLKHAGLVLPHPVTLKSINPGRKPHSIPEVTGVIGVLLENAQENTTFLSPNTYTNPLELRGVVHNDQLKITMDFQVVFPQQSPVWVFSVMVCLVPFHCSIISNSSVGGWKWTLCYNHPVIELVRQWRIFRGSFSIWKGKSSIGLKHLSLYNISRLSFISLASVAVVNRHLNMKCKILHLLKCLGF